MKMYDFFFFVLIEIKCTNNKWSHLWKRRRRKNNAKI